MLVFAYCETILTFLAAKQLQTIENLQSLNNFKVSRQQVWGRWRVAAKMLTLLKSERGLEGSKKSGIRAKIKIKLYKNRMLPESWTNSLTERLDFSKNLF